MQAASIDIKIKWPNDVYSKGLKIGGILCHSTYRSKEFQVVVGVGLNLDNSQPTTCVNDLLRLRHEELQLQSDWQPLSREVCLMTATLAFLTGLSWVRASSFPSLRAHTLPCSAMQDPYASLEQAFSGFSVRVWLPSVYTAAKESCTCLYCWSLRPYSMQAILLAGPQGMLCCFAWQY